MTPLKWITTEAKKLQKKYPKKSWTDLVKQASAIYASKHKKKATKKKATKKKVGATKFVEKGESKSANPKKVYQIQRTKKGRWKGVKRIAGTKTHKDSKSHNVNIRVVSGVDDINRLKEAVKLKQHLQSQLSIYKTSIPKHRTPHIKMMLKTLPQLIKKETSIINQLKKHIK